MVICRLQIKKAVGFWGPTAFFYIKTHCGTSWRRPRFKFNYTISAGPPHIELSRHQLAGILEIMLICESSIMVLYFLAHKMSRVNLWDFIAGIIKRLSDSLCKRGIFNGLHQKCLDAHSKGGFFGHRLAVSRT